MSYFGDADDNRYWDEGYVLKNPDQFPTTEYFWDCECEMNFIHPKCVWQCSRCGADQDERPDSRMNEVFAQLMSEQPESEW